MIQRLGATLLLIVLVVTGASAHGQRRGAQSDFALLVAQPRAGSDLADVPSVAVLFDNVPKRSPYADQFIDALTQRLMATGRFNVVDRAHAEAAVGADRMTRLAPLTRDSAMLIGRALGVNYVVVARFDGLTVSPFLLRDRVAVLEVRTGRVLGEFNDTQSVSDGRTAAPSNALAMSATTIAAKVATLFAGAPAVVAATQGPAAPSIPAATISGAAVQRAAAAAVVQRFYDWLLRADATPHAPGTNIAFWAPARDLLDGSLYAMLDKDQHSHWRPGPRDVLFEECDLLDPFGSTQMYDQVVRVTVGTPTVHGASINVPVTSLRTTQGRATYPFMMSVLVRYEGGAYRIADIHEAGRDGLRDNLIHNSRDPKCGWGSAGAAQRQAPASVALRWRRVEFRTVTLDHAAAAYPFLTSRVRDVRSTDATMSPGRAPTVSRVATGQLRPGLDLAFLSITGSNWCGSHGCLLDIYADDGSGYKPAGSLIADPPIYLSAPRASMLLCVGFGPPREWVLEGRKFVAKAPYTAADRPC
jgi:hypothetical protein